VKNLAFCAGLLIAAIGTIGIVFPDSIVWIAEHATSSTAFYCIATIRVAFGLLLLFVARVSRLPGALRVFGYISLVCGLATGLAGLIAIDSAHTLIEWWVQQGVGIMRLTSGLQVLIGAIVVYACDPLHYTSEIPAAHFQH